MPGPGWYPDPSGHPVERYFDGVQWTQAVRSKRRGPIFCWLLIAAGVLGAAWFFFAPIKETALGFTISCGNALQASNASTDGGDSSGITDGITANCHAIGVNHLLLSGVILVVGLIIGSVVWKWETD